MRTGLGHERLGATLTLAAVVVLLGTDSPTPWTGIGFVVVWATFLLAGRAFLPASVAGAPLREAVLAAGLGLTVGITAWSLSAYAFKRLWAGTAALAVCAALGLARWLAARPARRPPLGLPRGVVAGVLAGSLALGLYVEGFNEVIRGDEVLYSFRSDWETHLLWASLVREQGLPLVGVAGAPEAPFAPLAHTGLLCSLAGIDEMTATTPYQAARILSIGGFALLGLSALALVEASGLPRAGLLLASLAPLVWGSLSLPFDLVAGGGRAALDPYFSGAYPFTSPSGALYHNLTQLESIALAATALVAMGHAGSWTLAAVLLASASLVKPTIGAVLVLPLLVAACRQRASWRSIGGTLAALAAGVLLFYLPALLEDLPPGLSQRLDVAGLPGLLSLGTPVWLGLPGVAGCLWLARRGPAPATALALACGAGLVLAAVWSEPGRSPHANHTWALNGVLVLMAPYTVVTVLQALGLPRLVGLALLALHLISGALYAGRYPWLRPQSLAIAERDLLERIRESTRPGTSLFVDMHLVRPHGYPYLARPVPSLLHLVQTSERYDGETWRLMHRGQLPPRPLDFLARRDGVVLGPATLVLRLQLRGRGWRLAFRDESAGAQLWLRDGTGRDASGPLPAPVHEP